MNQSVTSHVNSKPADNLLRRLLRFWWVPVSFLVPFAIFYAYNTYSPYMIRDEDLRWALSQRVGIIGTFLAALIWGIWQVDVRIGGKEKLSECEDSTKYIVHACGIVLWLVFIVVGVVITKAWDQVYELPSVLPQLPQ